MLDLNEETLKIVILRSTALGDILTGLPAFRAVRRKFPEHKVYLTYPQWLGSFVSFLGIADERVGDRNSRDSDLADSGSRLKFDDAILSGFSAVPSRPDLAINLRGVRTATHLPLLDLNPKRYVGYWNPEVDRSLPHAIWRDDEHEVQRWCRLLNESGIPAYENDLFFAAPNDGKRLAPQDCTIVHPGAGSRARYWPAERWVEVIAHEKKRGENILITGEKFEIELANRIAKKAGLSPSSVLAGKTDLMGLVKVVSSAKKVLSTDTGIVHLAVALKIPTVSIYGPSSPVRWGPPSDITTHRVLWLGQIGEPYGDSADSSILGISANRMVRELDLLEAILRKERQN